MILNRELELPSAIPELERMPSTVGRFRTVLLTGAILLAFFAVVVALQIASGAYHSEFSGYPDEPAHYVTSLMVRSYLTHPDPLSPIKFAEEYYRHYPKVAFGHWPPVFYVVQAFWMMLFSSSRASIRLELAFTTALLAFAVFQEARKWFGLAAGVLAGFLTVLIPLVQTYADEEMSETLLVLLCFLSTVYFARYMDSLRWQDNLAFGIYFSLAVLTKGNGWLLAMVPPIALVLTRRLRVLKERSFWIAPVLVGFVCIPWQLVTMRVAEKGWAGGSNPSLHYTLSATGKFLVILTQIAGPVLFVVALIGITITVVLPFFRRTISSAPAAMLALIVAVIAFHALVPAGVEDRKMILAVPALVLFIFAGGRWIAERLPLGGDFARWRSALVVLIGALLSVPVFAIPREKSYGYIQVARFITSNPGMRHATILVSSECDGEGLLIAEIAMREPNPQDVIVRATKALADVDWNATEYHSVYSTPAEVAGYLRSHHIEYVVADTYPGQVHFLHNALLLAAVQHAKFAHLLAVFPHDSAAAGQVLVYQIDQPNQLTAR